MHVFFNADHAHELLQGLLAKVKADLAAAHVSLAEPRAALLAEIEANGPAIVANLVRSLPPGTPLGKAVAAIEAFLAVLHLPPTAAEPVTTTTTTDTAPPVS